MRRFILIVALSAISVHASPSYAAPSAQMDVSQPIPNGPKYPDTLTKRDGEAEVTVTADIDTNGRTVNCRVVASSNPEASKSSLEYCQRARYSPATLNGKPVVQYGKVYHFKFKLD